MAHCKHCVNCIYFGGQFDENCCCNYIFVEGHRRPCPPGDGCTAKRSRPRNRRMRSDRLAERKGGLIHGQIS